MNWRDHIISDPKVCHGQACIVGTRIPAAVVLANLADGMSVAELIEHYPSLTEDDIRATLHYAAAMALERIVDLPLAAG